MAHDTTALQNLGRRRRRLTAQLAELKPLLEAEIHAAVRADIPQVQIVEWTGYTREAIRLTDPAKRNARNARRQVGA